MPAGSRQPPVQGDVLWLSDFTYVATWTGFIYVACEGLRLPIHALEQHGDCVLDDCFR